MFEERSELLRGTFAADRAEVLGPSIFNMGGLLVVVVLGNPTNEDPVVGRLYS